MQPSSKLRACAYALESYYSVLLSRENVTNEKEKKEEETKQRNESNSRQPTKHSVHSILDLICVYLFKIIVCNLKI